MNKSRETDVPWPKEYIDERVSHFIDMQHCRPDEALKGHKIRLRKPKRYRPTTGKVRGNCPKCGKITWDFNPESNSYCSVICEIEHDHIF